MSLEESSDFQEMERDEDDSSSNSAEATSEDDDADEEKAFALRKELATNPYNYALHVQLISIYKRLADLDELRKAREQMGKLFPLTPELWLDWLTDEEKLAVSPEEKEKLNELFERAVKDYMSVSVWLEYVQYSIGNMGEKDGIEKVRAVFERALTAVGTHVTQGALIWEAYREFENALLLSLKATGGEETKVKEQEEKVLKIFKRQLSVPLLHMEKTYAEFGETMDAKTVSSVDHSYQKALKILKKLQPLEDALFSSEAPHTEEYMNYINFELSENDPIRIQNIYERCLVENCLKAEIWHQYAKYLDRKVKISSIAIPVHERAIRNCPWEANLWIGYGRALERNKEAHEKIVGVFETSLQSGVSEGNDFKKLWFAYLEYLRRKIRKATDSTKEVEEVFERASEQMATYFSGSDPEYMIMRYRAFFEIKYLKNAASARKLWDDFLGRHHIREPRYWLDYAHFEQIHGDPGNYKKVLLKALQKCDVSQDTFADMLISYEREEGTLESLDTMIEKCETHMHHVKKKRERESNAEQSNAKDSHNRKSPITMDSEGFKIPPPPMNSENRSEAAFKTAAKGRKRPSADSDSRNHPPKKQQRQEREEAHGESVQHDPLKDERTVFLSNLSYDITEEQIRESFSSAGEIEEDI